VISKAAAAIPPTAKQAASIAMRFMTHTHTLPTPNHGIRDSVPAQS
jgi:hypothetical protein